MYSGKVVLKGFCPIRSGRFPLKSPRGLAECWTCEAGVPWSAMFVPLPFYSIGMSADVSPGFLSACGIQMGVTLSKIICIFLLLALRSHFDESLTQVFLSVLQHLPHISSRAGPSPRLCSSGAVCDSVTATNDSTVTITHTAVAVSSSYDFLLKQNLAWVI